MISYDHSKNLHTQEGPRVAIPILFGDKVPFSLLDVGCGRGTWIKAAKESGVKECFGVDGVDITTDDLLFRKENFLHQDLTKPWDLKRRFDLVLCLEVAEHLDKGFAPILIDALTKHSDRIVFSAACPGQPGQHHVNCQWPEYWQRLFNDFGFVCQDEIRWKIWANSQIEPWYRQNLFVAVKNPLLAGREARLASVVHPDMIPSFLDAAFGSHVKTIENGVMPAEWYIRTSTSSFWSKLKRRLCIRPSASSF